MVNVPAYGSMSEWTPTRIRRLIEELVSLGCLAQSQGQYPMVGLTERGRAVLGGLETVEVLIEAGPVRGDGQGPAPDPALFERLRRWRAEVARLQGVPAYVVFHDRTLSELAAHRPADLAAMAALPGIGRSKLDRYGSALLEILASTI